MEKVVRSISMNLDAYGEKGLYLIFEDKTRLDLTRKKIDEASSAFWSDEEKIPSHVKSAAEFQRCHICPLKGKGGLCDAIKPVISLMAHFEEYLSYEPVTAIYRESEEERYTLSQTTMQQALKYVSVLSLMYYCQCGRKYWKYFFGVIPLMTGQEIAARVYLNIHWIHRGNAREIQGLITRFNEEILETSKNQVKRLNMISKSDAFINAFINTQIATKFLALGMEKRIDEAIEAFEASPSPKSPPIEGRDS
jgi:hypothetical protein